MQPNEQTLLPIVIETKTLVSTMMAQFDSYRKEDRAEKHEMAKQIGMLESKKVSIVDFEKQKEADAKSHDEMDKKIEGIQRVVWMASGAMMLGQFLISKFL